MGAIRAILANPRYTGRQVWNRQRKDEVLIDITDVAFGHMTKMRWNDEGKWIYSDDIVHPPIIDDERFEQAQQLLAAKNARQVVRRPRTSPRPYALRGVLFCGICRRRMQGTWNNDQPYYRCTFPSEYARTNQIHHPRTVYLREIEVLPELDTWLARALKPARLPGTIEALVTSQPEDLSPEAAGLRDEIAQCEQRLAQYRAALDAGGDPAVVGQWITETQAKKLAVSMRLRALTGAPDAAQRCLSRDEVATPVNVINDTMSVLRNADPADKAELYTKLGLRLTYNPGPRTVDARAEIGRTCTKGSCPRGESPLTYMPAITGEPVLGGPAVTGLADQWIRWTTTGCVALLACTPWSHGTSSQANPFTEEHEPRPRRGDLGEPAQEGKARHHRQGRHVNAAGVGGKCRSYPGRSAWCRLCCRVAAPTARIARCGRTGQKSAEAVVPAGDRMGPGRAERQVRRRNRGCSCRSR